MHGCCSETSRVMDSKQRRYSCGTATETLEWINAIIHFIKPYSFLINAHLVNFFEDRLWEAANKQWIDCLRYEPVQNLLLMPSGLFEDHWPDSLKQFIQSLRSLVFPRERVDLHKVVPGLSMISLNSVLAQGMNLKKRHEVEVLSALVSSIANSVGATTIVDVGSGQGYLAQVLSFQYRHSVVAIDGCPHHRNVTDARAERIKKYYTAQIRKFETFLECEEAKAVVSIGCCYNLLSKECSGVASSHGGFPMSCGVKSTGISLGKNSLDLACQSAERWNRLEKDAGLLNFKVHAFRAAFQMVLCKYYPEIIMTSPSVGRLGKALLRQQGRMTPQSALHHQESKYSSLPQKIYDMEETCHASRPADSKTGLVLKRDALSDGLSCNGSTRCEGTASVDAYYLFENFSRSGLSRLGLKPLQEIDFHEIWKEAEPAADLIGPYWSLRAALGPLLETLLLLDRLLFLQERGSSLETIMLPIFDPALSPRNVAIIAWRI